MADRKRLYELVIFDNDGVVVDSEPLAAQAMSESLSAAGYPVTPEESDRQFRGSTLTRIKRLVAEAGGPELGPDFDDGYQERLFQLMSAELQPVSGVQAVLDRLDQAQVPYCLASSGRRRRIQFALSAAGLGGRFDGRFWGAEDVAEGKPAPDLFLLAARSMAVPPSGCVVVEDAPVGVAAARAAGMTVLGFSARTAVADLAAADHVFSDMGQLPALLGL